MIFKRDLAANGVTQLEAIFGSSFLPSAQQQAAYSCPWEKMQGAPHLLAGATLEQNFASQFSPLPNQGLWKDSVTGLWMYLRPAGSQMSYGAPTAKAEDVVSSEGEAP